MSVAFNEYWLETGAAVPVDIETTAILLREIQRLRSEEQKPVAFRNINTGEFCTGGFLRKDWAKWQPLYAAPREWVGLTDEDRKRVRTTVVYNQFMAAGEYAEAVQKATEDELKEKNACFR
jgi:hypothetical protein